MEWATWGEQIKSMITGAMGWTGRGTFGMR